MFSFILYYTLIYFIIQLNTVKNDLELIMIKKPKVGRPKTIKSRKKTAKIFVNITESQKKTLDEKAKELDSSLSRICLQALKESGYL